MQIYFKTKYSVLSYIKFFEKENLEIFRFFGIELLKIYLIQFRKSKKMPAPLNKDFAISSFSVFIETQFAQKFAL